ncbi:MAG: esterase-like activity of phytase family protein [Pseudomonadota bacterium]
MRITQSLALAFGLSTALATPILAETTAFPATLAGHAILPAATFIDPPEDAPASLAISGRYTGGAQGRIDEVGTLPGASFLAPGESPRYTGLSTPFLGQPVQGFSGIKAMGDGTYWVLVDNGFGSKANSPDAMLQMHLVRPDWETGGVRIEETLFLNDANRVLPFKIELDGSESRYLTGADFDVESFQPIGDSIFIGDEFGPYLIEIDLTGTVTGFFHTTVGDATHVSPDNHGLRLPSTPDGTVGFDVRRSRGYEGMAAAPDGSVLYPMLEGPLWDAETGAWEMLDDQQVLRIFEFDTEARAFTENYWFYPLEAEGHAIGDFNMMDAATGLVIERDGNEGITSLACPDGEIAPRCFEDPATFKRVYRIELGEPGTVVRKIGYIDLLDIADPNGVAIQGHEDGRFTFPFVTIEDVDIVDDEHIIVGNDNNLPFSAGRLPRKQDDNEMILLNVADFLAAE